MAIRKLTELLVALLFIPTLALVLPPCLSTVFAADEAVEKFRQDRVKARAEVYVEEAKKEVQRGGYFRAIRLLSEAIKRGAGPEAYKLRGQAYSLSGSFPEAIDDISRAISSVPSDPSGYVLLGDVYVARRDYETALTNYETAIRNDPFFVEAYTGRGMALADMEKYALAIKDFQVVLQTNPNDPVFLANMGIVCLAADMPRAALGFFEKALDVERDPEARKMLEAKVRNFDRTSDFEERVGGLSGYLASMSDAYEGVRIALSPSGETGTGATRIRTMENQSRKDGGLASRQKSGGGIGDVTRPQGGGSASPGIAGSWAGTYLGMKWTISFKTLGQKVSGVISIFSPSGNEEIHHFQGTINKDYVEATAHSGFRFSGRLTEDSHIIGTATTPDGKAINVNMPLE